MDKNVGKLYMDKIYFNNILILSTLRKAELFELFYKYNYFGGKDRIRTCETLASLHAFQACALNHSATFPH